MAEVYEGLLRRLDELSYRWDEVNRAMSDPVNATNATRLVALSKERGKLSLIIQTSEDTRMDIDGAIGKGKGI